MSEQAISISEPLNTETMNIDDTTNNNERHGMHPSTLLNKLMKIFFYLFSDCLPVRILASTFICQAAVMWLGTAFNFILQLLFLPFSFSASSKTNALRFLFLIKNIKLMHLFLGWRAMEDRLGPLGHAIEYCLWGDGRARHTFLLASTDEHPLVLIEIDVGDSKKRIHKSMKLNIIALHEIPKSLRKIVFLGEIQSQTALKDLIRSAENYVYNHPDYHVLLNNCRTFVEYLIDQIPEFRQTVPRKNGSILEYYHAKAKHEHPGALINSQRFLKVIRDLHRYNQKCRNTDQLVLDIQLPQVDMNNNLQTIKE